MRNIKRWLFIMLGTMMIFGLVCCSVDTDISTSHSSIGSEIDSSSSEMTNSEDYSSIGSEMSDSTTENTEDVKTDLGEFYTLQEAYAVGLLKKEDIQIIANYHNNNQTLEFFDEQLVAKIKDLFAKELRENSNKFLAITSEEIVLTKFYGVYGNCYVVLLDYGYSTEEYIPFDLEIDGTIFRFGHPRYVNRLVLFKDLSEGD